MSSCIEVIPSPFGEEDGLGNNNGIKGRDEDGSPDTSITTSSSYVAARQLGSYH